MTRRWRFGMILLLSSALALAGCITLGGDEEESTGDSGATGDEAIDPSPVTVNDEPAVRGDADGDGQGQGQGQEQGQGQGQVQNVNQTQTVIVNVGPTPEAPQPATPAPTPTATMPATVEPTPPATTTPPPTGEAPRVWPSAGSHVAYAVEWYDVDGKELTRTTARAEWTHDGRDWHGTCTATEERQRGDGTTETSTTTRTYTASDPPHWPLFNTRQTPQQGGPVDTWHLHVCAIASGHHTYAGQTVTTWDGRAVAAHTAVENDDERDEKDFRTEWDTRTGLVLRYELRENDGDRLMGELVRTDAPLAWR